MADISELSFPFTKSPEIGQWQEVSPGILWLRMPLPFALDHINLWLLRDHEGWVIVDTGYALPVVKEAWQTVLAALDGPVTRIIVTHFHPDHAGLALWLQEQTGAPLYMTSSEFLTAHAMLNETGGHGTVPMLKHFRAHGLDETRLAELEERGNAYRKGVEGLPLTYFRIMDGDTLAIGDLEWQIICGYGHSPEHVSLYCSKEGVLISGDMLLPKISTNVSVFAVTPTADVLALYLTSLKRLGTLVLESALVLPSHGLPFKGLEVRIKALEAHHEERLAVLEESCDTPRMAGELLTTLFNRVLDTHQAMFAIGEAIAHLNYLEKAGRLVRTTDAQGKILYLRPGAAN